MNWIVRKGAAEAGLALAVITARATAADSLADVSTCFPLAALPSMYKDQLASSEGHSEAFLFC